MLTDTSRWSHTRGNEGVPSRWQATKPVPATVVADAAGPGRGEHPHTVRLAGAAIRPVTSVMNVSYPRALKHGQNRCHNCVRDPGGLLKRGIVAHA
jgi:hypothetical protein